MYQKKENTNFRFAKFGGFICITNSIYKLAQLLLTANYFMYKKYPDAGLELLLLA